MGFTVRTSIRTGPFRFNLSRAGVGVSVGVRGLRIGSGPRGHYVHMGRGALQYRVTVSPGASPTPRPRPGAPPRPMPSTPSAMDRIESASVVAMTDESAAGLLEQVRAAQARSPMAPLVGIGGFILLVLLMATGMPAGLAFVLAVPVTALAAAWVHVRDVAAREVVLFYDLEPDARAAYEALHTAFARLARAHAAWSVEARMDTEDQKRNAGASQLVERRPVQMGMMAPRVIRTNIDVPAIPCGAETLHFFPDRLLVSSAQGIGAIPYDQLRMDVDSHPFIEEGRVPSDAEQIGTTWKYVNRNGSPDRRFNDNRQLPVLRYEQVTFTSRTGLREVLQLSATGGGSPFRSAVERLGALSRALADAPPPSAAVASPASAPIAPPVADPVIPALPVASDGPIPALPRVDAQPMHTPSRAQPESEADRFARGLVEHMVVELGLRRVREIFADAGRADRVRPADALVFAALPFDVHFEVGYLGAAGAAMRAAFRRAVAERAALLAGASDPPIVAARLDEYIGVLFQPGQPLIRDDGMTDLARRATTCIIGGPSDDFGLRLALFTYFDSLSRSLGYGAVLGKLHEAFAVDGDGIWADGAA